MKKLSRKKKIILLTAIIILAVFIVLSIYRLNKIGLLDKSEFKSMYKQLEEDEEIFQSQTDLCNYITSWANRNGLDYELDGNNNIIFEQKATKRKSKVSPTVIVVNYNYENAVENRRVLCSAAMIAKTDVKSGKKTVIFVNNRDNDGEAYKTLSHKYFPNKAKVIFLDYGKGQYISTNSFCSADQTITVPSEQEDVTCDTCVKIHIGGLESDCIDTSVSKSVNPITLFSTVLTRLKSKSMICQLANVEVGNKSKMYPDSLDATIMLNSYQVASFTAYLDKRIKAFDKACKKDMPDAFYTYEVIEKSDEYPEQAYSKKTFNSLTTILYALKNGVYRYQEDDEIAEGYEEKDIYGIQCINQLRVEDGQIYIDTTSQANSNDELNNLLSDNKAASKLAKCKIETTNKIKKFNNDDTKLVSTLKSTYFKVNTLSGTEMSLKYQKDTYFTSMSYLSKINKKMDIVHIKEDSKGAAVITNMLLCYLQTKGNFLSL